jgi:hypothetical protein
VGTNALRRESSMKINRIMWANETAIKIFLERQNDTKISKISQEKKNKTTQRLRKKERKESRNFLLVLTSFFGVS